jgi:hypothetical protein
MCNGFNHHESCPCGFGGVRYLGSGYSLLDGTSVHDFPSYTDPNAKCPGCGERVYFYQSPDGGRVFFDELGWPWPKHVCTDNSPLDASENVLSLRVSEPARVPTIPLGWELYEVDSIDFSDGHGMLSGSAQSDGRRIYLRFKIIGYNWLDHWRYYYPMLIRHLGGDRYDLTTFIIRRSGVQELKYEARGR